MSYYSQPAQNPGFQPQGGNPNYGWNQQPASGPPPQGSFFVLACACAVCFVCVRLCPDKWGDCMQRAEEMSGRGSFLPISSCYSVGFFSNRCGFLLCFGLQNGHRK